MANLPLYVVDSEKHPLFGREWLNSLHLDWNILFKANKNISNKEHSRVRDSEINIVSLEDILSRYSQVSGPDAGEILGEPAALKFKPDTKPIFIRARPVPFALRSKIEAELDRLEGQGILIKVDSSPWATPIVPVCKANGQIRLCGDFKITVNKFLEVDEHPLPTLDELFSSMAGGEKFTKIDLRQAYLQLPVRPEDRVGLTLSTHKGLYQSTRLMYGLSSAPALWQRKIENILRDIPGVEVFIDDIKITAPNDEEHLHRLDLVLARLLKYNLRINLEKSEFMKDQIEYCGYLIDRRGIHKSSCKVEAIQRAPRPQNTSELKSFLGLVNYYARFFKNLSSILHPLHQLLRKDTKWAWNGECENTFGEIKQMMQSKNFLTHYSSDLPIVLATDASPTGVGAVISHIYPDGTEKPIQFASQSLNTCQRKWSQIDREAYAIVYGVKRFYQYLYGKEFILLTDNRPLTQIFAPGRSLPYMSATRMQHYAIFLQGFNYQIKYRTSEANANADFLSRFPLPSREPFQFDEADVFEIGQIENLPVTVEELAKATSNDKKLSYLRDLLMAGRKIESADRYGVDQLEFTVQRGCVMRGYRVVIPEALQKRILKELHIAHFGMSRMKGLARSFCWWAGIDGDIENLVRNCHSCVKNRNNPTKQKTHPWTYPSRAFERVHVDFAGPFLGTYFLILVDAYSKWPEVHMLTHITTQNTIRILQSIFSTFGLPEILVSDNGTQFTSYKFQQYLKENGIAHKVTAPYHPSTNGQAERYVQTIKSKLSTMIDCPDLWFKLSQILMQYRITPHPATGMSPSEILFRHPVRSRLQMMLPKQSSTLDMRKDLDKTEETSCRVWDVGSRVAARNYFGSSKWKLGTVLKRKGLMHYEIKLDDGRVWNRHIDQTLSVGNQVKDSNEDKEHLDSANYRDGADNVGNRETQCLPGSEEETMHDRVRSETFQDDMERESIGEPHKVSVDSSKPEIPQPLRRSQRISKPVKRLNL